MKLFKNPIFALLLAVIVVAASTLINTDIKLGQNCAEVEDAFFTADGSDKSIYYRLDARLDAANGLWTIATNYNNNAAIDIASARASLLGARERRDISDMYDANKTLQQAFDAAASTIGGYELTATEQKALESYQTTFAGAQKMIDEAQYNTDVLEFKRDTLNKFPASVLKNLVDIDEPELFE